MATYSRKTGPQLVTEQNRHNWMPDAPPSETLSEEFLELDGVRAPYLVCVCSEDTEPEARRS